jgi:hypothetical protein
MEINPMKNQTPKILIIGIHGPYQPWLEILENGQLKTWMASKSSTRIINVFGLAMKSRIKDIDQRIYYLRWSRVKFIAYLALILEAGVKKFFPLDKCRPNINFHLDGSTNEFWEVQMPDSLLLQGVKNVSVFRKSLELDFDFLVTTITSSYLNVALLEDALSRISPTRFLGGRIEKSGEMEYQQGSFRVYSRDVVNKLVENSHRYKHWKIEDIAMGDLVSKYYTLFSSLPNCTLESLADVESLTQGDLKNTISYRCKSIEGNKRIDSQIMKVLHKRILSGI